MEPAYTINESATKCHLIQHFTSLKEIFEEIENGYAILWLHHKIFFGEITAKNIVPEPGILPQEEINHIVRVRAFNPNKEIHFWRSGRKLTGRYREDVKIDNGLETIQYMDTKMVLRGVVASQLQKSEKTWMLVTRNYIGYEENTSQAGYVDSRFVNLIEK